MKNNKQNSIYTKFKNIKKKHLNNVSFKEIIHIHTHAHNREIYLKMIKIKGIIKFGIMVTIGIERGMRQREVQKV